MSEASPGRKLGKAQTGAMSTSGRTNPPAKRIGNRYPQTRKSGRK